MYIPGIFLGSGKCLWFVCEIRYIVSKYTCVYAIYPHTQTVQFKAYLLSVGIANPVTK